MRRVHGEATECIVFIGRAWTEQAMETRPGVPQNGENGLVFDRPRSKRDPIDREGSGVPQNGGNRPPMVKTGVLLIGRGVAYRKTGETDLERYGRNGGPVHLDGCGVPQNGTPRDTVHLHCRPPPASTGYHRPPPASTGYRRPPPASTGSYSSSLHRALLHRLLFNHPSTVYCSSSPPSSTVHPALHTTGSCSTTPPPSTVHPALHTTGSCSSRGNATAHCSSSPPPATLTVHPIDWLQLAAIAKETPHRVQLTVIDRSLGFSNA